MEGVKAVVGELSRLKGGSVKNAMILDSLSEAGLFEEGEIVLICKVPVGVSDAPRTFFDVMREMAGHYHQLGRLMAEAEKLNAEKESLFAQEAP